MRITSASIACAGALALGASAAPLVSTSSGSTIPPQLSFADDLTATGPFSLFSSLYSASKDLLTPRLVQLSLDQEPFWAVPQWLRWRGISFMDVTDYPELGSTYSLASIASEAAPFPTSISYDEEVRKVHSLMSEDGPREHIKKFTSFTNRYYKASTGKESQKWLLSLVKDTVKGRDDITVKEFEHPWGQNTIIATIEASNRSAAEHNGEVIVGAHQDSVNLIWPYLPAPGADDDGSGTMTQIESLRALMEAKYKPVNADVVFMWFSAEEGGLLGSQAVAQDYAKKNRRIRAMNQFDMTAFVKKGTEPRIGIITDNVNQELTEFSRLLVDKYIDVPYVNTALAGGAGSDHMSFHKIGAPAIFAIEAEFKDCALTRIHTTRDTWDHEEYSFEHIVRFSRLSSAFIIELAGWGTTK